MTNSGVLPRPIDVGPLRRCPACKRVLALKRISSEKRGEVKVDKYACKHCKHEVEHADRHPRGTI